MSEPPLNSNSLRKIAIIGGGVTGLSAAYQLIELNDKQSLSSTANSAEMTLFESGQRLGGVFGSERIEGDLIERGADSFITNKSGGIELCYRLGLEGELISTNPEFRRSLILNRGRPVPTPIGFNLMVPQKIWPLITTPLLSWSGKLRAMAERLAPRKSDPSDESLAAFVRRRFGNELFDNLAQPMVGGIYTSDPDRLSLRATFPRFAEMEQSHGSLLKAIRIAARESARSAKGKKEDAASGARYGLFASLKNGMQTLIDRLEERIAPHATINRGMAIPSIERTPAGKFSLAVQSRGQTPETGRPLRKMEFDGVILALPAWRSSELTQSLSKTLSQSLSQIKSASSAIVISGHRLSDFKHKLDAFGLVIPHRERRRILAVSFLSRKFENRAADGNVILRTFVGGAMQPDALQCSDGAMIENVQRELRDIFGASTSGASIDPRYAMVTRYHQAMPQYTIGHLDRVAAIRTEEASIPKFAIAGNSFEGVGIPDCIHNGEAAAHRVWESLFPVAENNPPVA